MVLVGDIQNDFIVKFLQASWNLDLDWVPYDYLPEIWSNKTVLKSVETDQKF